MPLHPQVKSLLDQMAGAPPRHSLPVAEARRLALSVVPLAGESEAVAHTFDRALPGPTEAQSIPVRFYYPRNAPAGPLPALVYFHGGGWTIGSIETLDPICRALANGAGCVVMSVGYRLAPEHKFPAAVEDAYAATAWLAANAAEVGVDPTRLAVGGDSSGGNLAAVVALLARDKAGPALVFQMLVYPITAYHTPGTASYQENAEGYYLTRADMVWFWQNYLNHPDEGQNPLASPLLAEDLSNLPPALLIITEFDPLRDEGEAYAARLQAAGVPVTLTRYDGMIHNFFRLGGVIEAGQTAIAECCGALRERFSVGFQ